MDAETRWKTSIFKSNSAWFNGRKENSYPLTEHDDHINSIEREKWKTNSILFNSILFYCFSIPCSYSYSDCVSHQSICSSAGVKFMRNCCCHTSPNYKLFFQFSNFPFSRIAADFNCMRFATFISNIAIYR